MACPDETLQHLLLRQSSAELQAAVAMVTVKPGLSLIRLLLCLLENWERTREEGGPETATASKKY